MKAEVYEKITERIVTALEAGTIPWKKGWSGNEAPINYVSRKPYRGINRLMCDKPGEWLTFKQAKDAGGNVKKGEKGTPIVIRYTSKKTYTADDGTEQVHFIPCFKTGTVFHISQCEGVESKVKPQEAPPNPIEVGEQILKTYVESSGVGFNIVEGSERAFYRPSSDAITLPSITQFVSAAEYYSTAFHESVHSTGHSSRLKRFGENDDGVAAFGDDVYSKEELVAEIGAAMLMSESGLETPATFQNNAAYLRGWLEALKGDKTLIVQAASAAQKAADFILGRREEEVLSLD